MENENVEKKTYEKPEMEVIELTQNPVLLAGSPGVSLSPKIIHGELG
ncbi:MAG: hypothetical protein IIT56_10775 [Bacteroidales bacterium]|nr:hypothetical protein [Bacteroidales bacterium]